MTKVFGCKKFTHEFERHIGKYIEIYHQNRAFLGCLKGIVEDEGILNPYRGTIFSNGNPELGWVNEELGANLSARIGYAVTTKEDAEKVIVEACRMRSLSDLQNISFSTHLQG